MTDLEKYMIADESVTYIPISIPYKRGDEPKLIAAALAALAIALGVHVIRNRMRQNKLSSTSPEYQDKLSKWGIDLSVTDQRKNDQKIDKAAKKVALEIVRSLRNLKSNPKLSMFDASFSGEVYRVDTSGYLTYEITLIPDTDDAKKILRSESFKASMLALIREKYPELFDTGLLSIKTKNSLGKTKIIIHPKYF